MQVEKELKERELQIAEKGKLLEFVEKDKAGADERALEEKNKLKLEFDEKLDLNLKLAEEKKRNELLLAEIGKRPLLPAIELKDLASPWPPTLATSFQTSQTWEDLSRYHTLELVAPDNKSTCSSTATATAAGTIGFETSTIDYSSCMTRKTFCASSRKFF